MTMTRKKLSAAAFSLLELLGVLAVVGVLLAIAVPTINSSMRGSSLGVTGQGIVDQFNLARQTALSRNLPVEVRLYLLPDYDKPSTSTPTVYRALQSFILVGNKAEPLSKLRHFGKPVICSDNPAESSMLTLSALTAAPDVPLSEYDLNYQYRSFYFKPNGAPSLTGDPFLTLVLANKTDLSKGENYYTIQLDPLTGRPRVLRP